MPRRAQPVPPIFQPEVAARAVVYAADHPSRGEYWVGAPDSRNADRQQGHRRAARPVSGVDGLRVPANRRAAQDPGRPANSGLRWTTSPARTSAHTAVSTGAPRPVALSCGCHGTAARSRLRPELRRPVSARRWAPAVVADEPAAIATVAPGVGAIAASGGDGQSENAGGRAHPQVLQCVRLSACVGCQAVETGGLGFALRGGDGA